MKKGLVVLVPVLVGGAIVGRRFLPAEWRESLARLPGVMMTRMLQHMPDE